MRCPVADETRRVHEAKVRAMTPAGRVELAHQLGGQALDTYCAAHGVDRSTLDIDLFTVDHRVLDAAIWDPLRGVPGRTIDARRGDADDPLGGVVQLTSAGDRPVDLIVGRSSWQANMAAEAVRTGIHGIEIPVIRVSDLILLTLYAGGPQDVADIHQLPGRNDRDGVVDRVNVSVASLPGPARARWARIIEGGGGSGPLLPVDTAWRAVLFAAAILSSPSAASTLTHSTSARLFTTA